MKKFTLLFCLMLGIFSEGSSFAASKPKASQPSYKSAQKFESIASYEEKCLKEINVVRAKHGLKALRNWNQLSDCARGHSANMAAKKCPLGHDGFDNRYAQMKKTGCYKIIW
ncbi:MAG: CAP domain-containing protein [Candidatus Protochlamydia sp.]|nr:CAP domain-containing protein [Candidatus Protochlamydia sp.]